MRDSRRRRTVLVLLLLTALTLLVLSLRGGGQGAAGTAAGLFAPVENATAAVVRPIRDFFGSVTSIGSKDQRIAELQRQVDALQGQLHSVEYDHQRAQELNDLLRVAGAGQYTVVPAQVIAVGPTQGFAWTVTIDAGSADGVAVDQNVINGQGLVGHVVSVTRGTATVVLLVDATATVGARVESSMEVGYLNGTGDPSSMEMQLIDPFAPVTVGQRLVSWGVKGGVYAPGIPLGTITDVRGTAGQLTRVATVTPFIDPTSLDLVGVVVVPPRTDPRDSVLPPVPTPSASASPGPSAAPTDSGSVSPSPGSS